MLRARWIRAAGLFALGLAIGTRATRVSGQAPSLRARGAIDALVADAGVSPPEFAADLFIRFAGSPASAAKMKHELVESAFNRAYAAGESYRRVAPMARADGRVGGFVRAYETGIDLVTLQVRAALAMVPIDPERAREMFEWIDFYLPAATCSDA